MRKEVLRQSVHFGGLAFVWLSQFFPRQVSAIYFIIIGFSFLFYSWYLTRLARLRHIKHLDKVEKKVREKIMTFERDSNLHRPFLGPFWLFMGFAVAYLLFPLEIAMAACAILCVGDAFSTIAGKAFGRRVYLPGKSLEGTVAFFLTAFIFATLIVPWHVALVGALAGALIEPLPALKHFSGLTRRGLLDDNLLIPLASGFAMLAILML